MMKLERFLLNLLVIKGVVMVEVKIMVKIVKLLKMKTGRDNIKTDIPFTSTNLQPHI